MFRKTIIVLASFLLVGCCVFAAGAALNLDVRLPQTLEATSPCPAVGCTSGQCHGFDNVPEPDGIHEMTCPEEGCASKECHAWDTLSSRYYQASDASLNLWVLAPAVLILGLVMLVKKL